MNKKILDFGAGWKAMHTQTLRAAGLDVTAHDFGRNFDPNIHDRDALTRQYDVVFASNVLNVQITPHSMRLACAQIALATSPIGIAVVNYPDTPRKMPNWTRADLEEYLSGFFGIVVSMGKNIWRLEMPFHDKAKDLADLSGDYTNEEMSAANIRPAGAVGKNAIVPRMVLSMMAPRVVA